MAQEAGFQYYVKISWKKGTFVSNTGRKAKNTEDIMIFTKGKPRSLRPDKQRGVDENGNPTKLMSGANGMLPTEFCTLEEINELNVQAVPNKQKICKSEKPVELFEQLLDFFTKEGETVLDQFAGSGAVGIACLNKNRKCILIEKSEEQVEKIKLRIDKIKHSTEQ